MACRCRTTIANILKRSGIPPAPTRQENDSWAGFIEQHNHLWAADFFTVDIPQLPTKTFFPYYVLFFINISTRKIVLGGITISPHEEWMKQTARNLTCHGGPMENTTHLIHDRDSKFAPSFDCFLKNCAGIKPIKLPAESPNLNASAERFVRSIKEECLEMPRKVNTVRRKITQKSRKRIY